MAIIWITHDLGIIAGLADRVNVMYGGYIIETAPVKDIYKNPQHPYTIGLLGSLPEWMKWDTDVSLQSWSSSTLLENPLTVHLNRAAGMRLKDADRKSHFAAGLREKVI